MARPKPRNYTIDGKPYAISISGGEIDRDQNVHLHVTFRALFGYRSCCLLRGLVNRSYWHDYPNIEQMRAQSISLTPRIVCELVRLAHSKGWKPETDKANLELDATDDDFRTLIASNHVQS